MVAYSLHVDNVHFILSIIILFKKLLMIIIKMDHCPCLEIVPMDLEHLEILSSLKFYLKTIVPNLETIIIWADGQQTIIFRSTVLCSKRWQKCAQSGKSYNGVMSCYHILSNLFI